MSAGAVVVQYILQTHKNYEDLRGVEPLTPHPSLGTPVAAADIYPVESVIVFSVKVDVGNCNGKIACSHSWLFTGMSITPSRRAATGCVRRTRAALKPSPHLHDLWFPCYCP